MRRPLVLLAGVLLGLAGPAANGTASTVRRTPVVKAVKRVAPATVNITTTQQVHRRGNPFFRADPLFEEFFGRFLDPRPRAVQSLGTGVIVDTQGHVLTNQHVLAGAVAIRITLGDGREFDGELIGADPETDLAVLRILTEEALPVAPLGRSDDLMIGETVIAIGNPFGLHHTVTTGVLSATNRSIRGEAHEYHGFLQTDASINPGNSGGPLLNLDGEVIGINTAIFREAEGIGFAIPIGRARRIVEELIEHGELVPVWLGLRLQELTRELREGLGVRATGGALVSHVFPDSPAARAGIERGDVVVALDGTRIQRRRNYFELLRGLTAGHEALLVVEREGETHEHRLRAEAFPEERSDEFAWLLMGLAVADRNGGPAERGEPSEGVVVDRVMPRSPAARVGLRPGDVILKIGQDRVENRVAFRRAVTKLRGRSQALLVVQRARTWYHVTLGLS